MLQTCVVGYIGFRGKQGIEALGKSIVERCVGESSPHRAKAQPVSPKTKGTDDARGKLLNE